MAINPETLYPGKINPSTPDYPYGSARNITAPGDGTGTPWEAAIVNDLLGFQQAILARAGIVPSGTPDKATASQYLQALEKVNDKRYTPTFATVAALAANTPIDGDSVAFQVGDTARVAGENNNFSEYVIASSGDEDKGDVDIGASLWAVKLHRNNSRWDQEGFNTGGPVPDSPNVIAGCPDNYIVEDVHSSTISGGGIPGRENVIGGIAANVNTSTSNVPVSPILGTVSQFCLIGGGYDNVVNGLANVITVGQHCIIDLPADHGSIHGGSNNKILAGSYNTIGGGTRNTVAATATSGNNLIAGGADNTMVEGTNSTIGGGSFNSNSGEFSTISGGQTNTIGASGDAGVIGGGSGNNVDLGNSTIGGGNGNDVSGAGQGAAIGGGINNHAEGESSAIPGGRDNEANANYTQASGYRAVAERAGQEAFANDYFTTKGDVQSSRIILKAQTTDATQTNLADLAGGISFPTKANIAIGYRIRVVGHRTDAQGDNALIVLEGVAHRGPSGVWTITKLADQIAATAGAAAWAAEIYDSVGSLRIRVTGEAAKDINWAAHVEYTENIG
jgi:hypothetical protein